MIRQSSLLDRPVSLTAYLLERERRALRALACAANDYEASLNMALPVGSIVDFQAGALILRGSVLARLRRMPALSLRVRHVRTGVERTIPRSALRSIIRIGGGIGDG